jgi:hypothetical protein
MKIDEIKALENALAYARKSGVSLDPPLWIDFSGGAWEIGTVNEPVVRIDSETGKVLSVSDYLDPVKAFSLAKKYAARNSLPWGPGFSLNLETEYWNIGSCQSQLGGQANIFVTHSGGIVEHNVNPK